MDRPDERPALHVAAFYWCILAIDSAVLRTHRLLDRLARLRAPRVPQAEPQRPAAQRGNDDGPTNPGLSSRAADGHA